MESVEMKPNLCRSQVTEEEILGPWGLPRPHRQLKSAQSLDVSVTMSKNVSHRFSFPVAFLEMGLDLLPKLFNFRAEMILLPQHPAQSEPQVQLAHPDSLLFKKAWVVFLVFFFFSPSARVTNTSILFETLYEHSVTKKKKKGVTLIIIIENNGSLPF